MRPSCKIAARCTAAALSWAAAMASPANSQNPPPAAQPKANAAPAKRPGDVDIKRSRVYAHTGITRFGHEHGFAGRLVEGNLQLGAATNAGKLVFDTASLADDPAARKLLKVRGDEDASTRKKVDETMHGGSVLDVRRFPQATFDVKAATRLPEAKSGDPARYQLEGKFTLHGKTQPLKIEAQAETVDGAVRLRGQFSIRQTDYGIQPYSKLGGAIGVANEVKIVGDIWLEPPAAN
jgi:polyisoprenoid-binding protein YceI